MCFQRALTFLNTEYYIFHAEGMKNAKNPNGKHKHHLPVIIILWLWVENFRYFFKIPLSPSSPPHIYTYMQVFLFLLKLSLNGGDNLFSFSFFLPSFLSFSFFFLPSFLSFFLLSFFLVKGTVTFPYFRYYRKGRSWVCVYILLQRMTERQCISVELGLFKNP